MHSFSGLHLGDGLLWSPTIPGRGCSWGVSDVTKLPLNVYFLCCLMRTETDNPTPRSARTRSFKDTYLSRTVELPRETKESLTSQENLGGSIRVFLSAKPRLTT